MDRIQQYDEYMILWIREHLSCSFLDTTMKAVSFLGDNGFVWIMLTILLLIFVKKWRIEGIILGISLGLSTMITNTLKPFIARFRPYDVLSMDIIIAPLSDYSFPSGHTTAAFAGAFVLWHINKNYGKYAFLFAILMAFSRVYLAVHYFTDVLIGAIIGSISAWIVIFTAKKIFDKKVK